MLANVCVYTICVCCVGKMKKGKNLVRIRDCVITGQG